MKLLDRIAFNRSMSIVFNFIISLIKLFMPKLGKELEDNHPVPPLPRPPLRRRPRPPILKKENKKDE
jgi:hypothetical protein